MGLRPVTAHHLHGDACRTDPRAKTQQRLRTQPPPRSGRGLSTQPVAGNCREEELKTLTLTTRHLRLTISQPAAAYVTFNL